jgi:DNA (cytosine-5)-methyltransferase 1
LIKFVAGGKDNFLSAYYGVTKNFNRTYEQTAKSVDEPCGVLTTENRFAKVQCSFIQQRNSGNPEHKIVSVERPARTITATGGNQELVQAKFLGVYCGKKQNQNSNAISVDNPAPTITVWDRISIIQPKYLCSYNFKDSAKDIEQPCPTLLTKDRLSLVSPHFIVNEYSGGGQHSSIDEVCPAVLTTPKQKVISCKWVMDTAFNNKGTSIENPMPTITANRKWHYLMNPQYYSKGDSIDNPCFTLITRMDKQSPCLVATESGIAIKVYETDSEPMRRIKEFMAIYGIADIKMRMLKIPELKRIMGFPEDYTLIGTQAEQKKYIGNAVEVNMARVMCEALVTELHDTEIFKTAA